MEEAVAAGKVTFFIMDESVAVLALGVEVGMPVGEGKRVGLTVGLTKEVGPPAGGGVGVAVLVDELLRTKKAVTKTASAIIIATASKTIIWLFDLEGGGVELAIGVDPSVDGGGGGVVLVGGEIEGEDGVGGWGGVSGVWTEEAAGGVVVG